MIILNIYLSYTNVLSYIGYVALDPCLLMAAGLGIAQATSDKQNPWKIKLKLMIV